MSIASLEVDIVNRAKELTGDSTLTRKRLVAWRTGVEDQPIDSQEGDTVVFIPSLLVWACFEPKKVPVKK